MPRSVRVVIALSLLTVVAVAVSAARRHRVRQAIAIAEVYKDIRPVPTNAPHIPALVLAQLVNADFKIVTNLRYVPSSVKESFCNVERCNYIGVKFDMVNPGDIMSTDNIIEGVPNKRLVFAALNKESAIVVYERGGYANILCAAIIDFRDGSAWGSALNNHKVKNMHDLRAALAEEEYIDRRGGE
jgi:hypothetical protein